MDDFYSYYLCAKINTMKYLYALALLALVACKNQDKETYDIPPPPPPTYAQVDVSTFPENLQQVLAAHGGLQDWSEMRSMTYTMGEESHTTDLKSRDIIVEQEKTTIGSIDGKVWIAQDSTYFPPQRARFYHNLMFYFYAMPFLLADDGIVYSDAPALEMDGVTYPAIQVGYEANVGDSPEDEYILYYHPETHKMEWLAYTVTYGKNEKSTKFSYIKYNKWQEVNGLLLPEELTWYTVEDGKPVEARGEPRVFSKVAVDRAGLDITMFEKPENGAYVD